MKRLDNEIVLFALIEAEELGLMSIRNRNGV
jgi:hypothetical protein